MFTHCPFRHKPLCVEHSSTSDQCTNTTIYHIKALALLLFLFYWLTFTDARTYAVAVVWVLKAGVAETVVGAHCVLAGSIATGLSLTLVHIWNQRESLQFYLRRYSHYSLSRVTLLRPHVKKKQEPTQLTNTHCLVLRCFEAIGADAAVASQQINAPTRIAYARVLNAFISVWKRRKTIDRLCEIQSQTTTTITAHSPAEMATRQGKFYLTR